MEARRVQPRRAAQDAYAQARAAPREPLMLEPRARADSYKSPPGGVSAQPAPFAVSPRHDEAVTRAEQHGSASTAQHGHIEPSPPSAAASPAVGQASPAAVQQTHQPNRLHRQKGHADTIGGHDGRHVIPECARVMQLPRSMRDTIGYWRSPSAVTDETDAIAARAAALRFARVARPRMGCEPVVE